MTMTTNEKVDPISPEEVKVTHEDGIPLVDPRNGTDIIRHRSEAYYTQFLSDAALQRKPSAIHALVPLEQTPGVVSLLAGKPNSTTFPFTQLTFTAPDPSPYTEISSSSSSRAIISVTLKEDLLSQGLQYTATPGMDGLIEWFEQLQERVHGRNARREGWSVSVGCGARELVGKSIEAFVNPGGPVLVDADTKLHLHQIPIFQVHSCRIIDIPTDSFGILPSTLETILETWNVTPTNPRPKILFTIPYGVGPETCRERRLEVLKVVRKWGVIILEDDPYYYLTPPSKRARAECSSYFALETELSSEAGVVGYGHVVRYDTLTTTLGPGLGVGWISGPGPLVGVVDTYSSSANLQAPSVSQAVALALLRAWGHEGFLKYVEG
ncbi:hypothetical protein E1B28_009660 [Marasmius oreades]|uniref:Aminotransferase class I/classII domain-containing protein n=1 Tax=Marasmius oreades TaxID=181124 RepID=A0A9P7RVP3_9AGAR|nr:uncharacterized protein E1B28_009660 [Marasmius oreades]KAG7090552.1 hypothetical protein E1B28_009660 [Marasmius oreades]